MVSIGSILHWGYKYDSNNHLPYIAMIWLKKNDVFSVTPKILYVLVFYCPTMAHLCYIFTDIISIVYLHLISSNFHLVVIGSLIII